MYLDSSLLEMQFPFLAQPQNGISAYPIFLQHMSLIRFLVEYDEGRAHRPIYVGHCALCDDLVAHLFILNLEFADVFKEAPTLVLLKGGEGTIRFVEMRIIL